MNELIYFLLGGAVVALIVAIWRSIVASDEQFIEMQKRKMKHIAIHDHIERRLQKLEQFKKDSELSLPIVAVRLEKLEGKKRK